ncbi:MAG TPA: GIY-YIG nuclease family protein [Bacteroidia bacterium]|jgi:putative endonuclease|nr:GIY-YIG nuclease family protein [Bacteroidia bacterium]
MKNNKYLYVYILLCADESYYTGITNNPEQRLMQHNSGKDVNAYTYSRRPVTMVYCEKFMYYHLAISWEKRIKGWSRAKKEALINENWEKLKHESKCKNETSHLNTSRLRSK